MEYENTPPYRLHDIGKTKNRCKNQFFSFALPALSVLAIACCPHYLPIQLTAVRDNDFSFQCLCAHVFMDSGLFINTTFRMATVSDAFFKLVPFKATVYSVLPTLPARE